MCYTDAAIGEENSEERSVTTKAARGLRRNCRQDCVRSSEWTAYLRLSPLPMPLPTKASSPAHWKAFNMGPSRQCSTQFVQARAPRDRRDLLSSSRQEVRTEAHVASSTDGFSTSWSRKHLFGSSVAAQRVCCRCSTPGLLTHLPMASNVVST